jgi:hypothetical protein
MVNHGDFGNFPCSSPVQPSCSFYDYLVDVGNVWLPAGTYYLALQDVSSFFDNFLALGTDFVDPAVKTMDGGVPWTEVSFDIDNVAVSVEGIVPEPGSLPLLVTGMGFMAWLVRRRSELLRAS